MKKFAVLGNPINHSKSPFIHKLFAKQFKIKNFYYEKIFVDVDKFEIKVNEFFLNYGNGINITLPFKTQAFNISNKLTERAKLSKTVNTLKKENGFLIGDNTDGIGLLEDLKNLNMINKNYKILIIGAGGAAQSIIPVLLSFGCFITITNRTLLRAINLYKIFESNKNIKILDSNKIDYNFDLIINATSASTNKENLILPESLLINKSTKCYDICYQKSGMTPFLKWCKSKDSMFLSDGIGMLVNQAAYSFLFWNGIFPDVKIVIKKLKSEC